MRSCRLHLAIDLQPAAVPLNIQDFAGMSLQAPCISSSFFSFDFFSQLVCACVCSFLSCRWNILAMRTHYIQVRFDSLKI
ncbi:hypothetical protein DAI22_02g208600 [Oryza sativa Japonica Group]|nr:hypothetical protein DAI22_02g208600 [Oryza sativa Japonica Group]